MALSTTRISEHPIFSKLKRDLSAALIRLSVWSHLSIEEHYRRIQPFDATDVGEVNFRRGMLLRSNPSVIAISTFRGSLGTPDLSFSRLATFANGRICSHEISHSVSSNRSKALQWREPGRAEFFSR